MNVKTLEFIFCNEYDKNTKKRKVVFVDDLKKEIEHLREFNEISNRGDYMFGFGKALDKVEEVLK